jgi:prepilin-type processing-associated H-X9-DG protein
LPGRGQGKRLSAGELLAALAIIGALSTLVLPTFARARANARQAVCMANIRAVALAVGMYLAESDNRFPPREHRQEAYAYFNSYPGGGGVAQWAPGQPGAEPVCHRAYQCNPYLRWPVILDPYLPSRAVWECPNARLVGGASFIIGPEDWLGHLAGHQGEWGRGTEPWVCPAPSWPAGWGGEVTDSLTQRRMATAVSGKGIERSRGAFVQSVAANERASAEPSAQHIAASPAWYVICADGGATLTGFCTGSLAYPDLCHLECAGPGDWEADWVNCPWSRECGATAAMKLNPELRQGHARHLGGVNLGFLDGHARWMPSEQVIAEAPSHGNRERGHLRGFDPWGPTRDAPWYDPGQGIPALY